MFRAVLNSHIAFVGRVALIGSGIFLRDKIIELYRKWRRVNFAPKADRVIQAAQFKSLRLPDFSF